MNTKIINTPINGVKEIINEPFKDDRGEFSNLLNINDPILKKIWGARKVNQVNHSVTSLKGTIRGLHWQREPHQEFKIIRCIKGRVWDVAVDLRDNSDTYLCWHAVELDSRKYNSILIPENCAHGFQALENNCELIYIHSENWVKGSESGLRWNDPYININWPLEIKNISDRDKNLPFYK